jgi:hypothetical protein
MSPGPVFDRIYCALKAQIMRGRFAPGAHLEPVAIGAELHASITPVRDALHRLVGERLVEAPGHDGFRAPLLTEFGLRHLYALNSELLLLSIKAPPTGRAPGALPALAPDAGDNADRATDIFQAVGELSANPEHRDAIMSTCARLGAARMAEPLVFDDMPAELTALQHLLELRDISGLRRGIVAYHRRRRQRTPSILEMMHRRPGLD